MFAGVKMYDLIWSIPGFGRISAAYLTSMIMDIGRFPSRNSFTAYFGIVPKMRESANTTQNCATTHRGDEEVRRLLMQTDVRIRAAPREMGSEPICSSMPKASAERVKDDLVSRGGRSGLRVLRHMPDEREIR